VKAISNGIGEAGCPSVGLQRFACKSEKGFKRVKGFASIPDVIAMIEAEQADEKKLKSAA